MVRMRSAVQVRSVADKDCMFVIITDVQSFLFDEFIYINKLVLGGSKNEALMPADLDLGTLVS